MNRETFEKGEDLIAHFCDGNKPEKIKEALYHYLLAAAEGRQPTELQQQAVLHYIALGLENQQVSISMNKTKRAYRCADDLLFTKIAAAQRPTGEAIEKVAEEFGLNPEALRKRAERSGVLKEELKWNAVIEIKSSE